MVKIMKTTKSFERRFERTGVIFVSFLSEMNLIIVIATEMEKFCTSPLSDSYMVYWQKRLNSLLNKPGQNTLQHIFPSLILGLNTGS